MERIRTMAEISIDEFMTRDVLSIDQNETIDDLIRIFNEHEYNAIPVLENGRLIGIVNKIDLMTIFRRSIEPGFHQYRDLMQFRVREIMRQAVITVGPGDTIQKALEYMIGFKLRSIPVVNSAREVVGIISRKDIMKKLFDEDPDTGK